MKKTIILVILVLLLGLAAIFQLKNHFAVDMAPLATPPSHFSRMLHYHARMDANAPDGSVIFIGDSLVQGLAVTAVANPSMNYGIGGDTTEGVLKRLSQYKSIDRAKLVVIAIGVNDMSTRSNDEILENYKAIADRIPGAIPVLFSAVLPVDEKNPRVLRGVSRERILGLNERLKEWAGKVENVYVVDAGPQLVDEQGNLQDQFHVGDGVHLNSRGNAIWIAALKNAVQKICAP